MKTRSRSAQGDELRPNYNLGELLKDGVQGKYAARYRAEANLVMLAPDVAKEFPSEKAVNDALRLVIQLRNVPSKAVRTPRTGK